jgi:hypothetical protein
LGFIDRKNTIKFYIGTEHWYRYENSSTLQTSKFWSR